MPSLGKDTFPKDRAQVSIASIG